MRKFKFETVNDAKRATDKLFRALYDRYGYGPKAFSVKSVVYASSKCKTQANVLMYASYTTNESCVWNRVGIDEFGKVFFSGSSCNSSRFYI